MQLNLLFAATALLATVSEASGLSSPSNELQGGLLDKRACWNGAAVGCGKGGYCWKTCNSSGGWCWTASYSNGQGPWITCKADSDCNAAMACGAAVPGKSCDTCGCDCRDKN
ncbi:IDI-2 precursor [Apiospora sp. TS-2023a]